MKKPLQSACGEVTPDQAIARLMEGNARYVAQASRHDRIDAARRQHTAQKGQKPFAVVLTCSDSRVPPEYLFDQGIGDLFVIRVAGNIAGTHETGSAEYGVEHLGAPVLLVLGHTQCGAVTAAVAGGAHGCIAALLRAIEPAVAAAKKMDARGEAVVQEAIVQNVWLAIETLLAGSERIRGRARAGTVKVVGGLYDTEAGTVKLLGAHPREQEMLAAAAP
jgi:carbonic anhydrase